MNYSLKIKIGADGQPVIESVAGPLPPAGHTITVTGQYEIPRIVDDQVIGQVSINTQHFDGTGDHVVSAMQYHDRFSQGPTASDVKIVERLRRQAEAIRDAELYKADPSAPLPPTGPTAESLERREGYHATEGYL